MTNLDELLASLKKAALEEPAIEGVEPIHRVMIPEDIGDYGFSSIVKRCVYCKGTTEIILITPKYQQWRGGHHVQDLWPMMSVGDRETLISGTHSDCFDAMFKEDDDDR